MPIRHDANMSMGHEVKSNLPMANQFKQFKQGQIFTLA
ncbi:hypothetical protein EJK51_1331 [Moraxella catarrhalis]|nr:hypothetical protein MCR_1282 [Moraxella catarrhalis BBH18]AZQ88062.1 hypothetical protein EJK52_1332 [Moraxella catarrhalis]AZQ89889.1 hypothetical protein EJK50_1396 [Moraxella catarrhalis]AZQ91745.1 hypothetical protein EJK51_1331 [Moraxella catarrhalis]EKF83243.1 hypothetical protein MCRH_1354 [Moraxella catarrhalis RH4]